MSDIIKLTEPFSPEAFSGLHMGDMVEITGTIYTARDAAHKRLIDALEARQDLPFEIAGSIIYYAGPSPAKPGSPIGSCGPTTSGRMDAYTPALLDAGLIGMVGKGPRSHEVIEAMKKHGAVYFAAVGGAAALTAQSIVEAEIVAYEDLGPEAIRRLKVVNYPCMVAIDSSGRNIYEEGPRRFAQ